MATHPEPQQKAGASAKLPEPLWRHIIGEELRRLRHERGETLGETARRAGVSPQYLSEMERGVKDPSSEMIAAVAHALGVRLLDLTNAVVRRLEAAYRPSDPSRAPMVLVPAGWPSAPGPSLHAPSGAVLSLVA